MVKPELAFCVESNCRCADDVHHITVVTVQLVRGSHILLGWVRYERQRRVNARVFTGNLCGNEAFLDTVKESMLLCI